MLELLAIAHRCGQCGGRDRADPGDGLQPARNLIFFGGSLNLAIELLHALIQFNQVRMQADQQPPEQAGQAVLGVFLNLGQGTSQGVDSHRNDNAIFRQEAPDLVGLGGALADQFAADAMHGQHVLLGNGLDRDEAHVGPPNRFADRLGVVGIVLLALHVGFDELRCDQLDVMPHAAEFACPVMGAGASFHANQTGREFLEEFTDLTAGALAFDHDAFITVDAVDLKYDLCQIQTNAGNVHFGLLPF